MTPGAGELVFSSSSHFPMPGVRLGSHVGVTLDPCPGEAPSLVGATSTDRGNKLHNGGNTGDPRKGSLKVDGRYQGRLPGGGNVGIGL